MQPYSVSRQIVVALYEYSSMGPNELKYAYWMIL